MDPAGLQVVTPRATQNPRDSVAPPRLQSLDRCRHRLRLEQPGVLTAGPAFYSLASLSGR